MYVEIDYGRGRSLGWRGNSRCGRWTWARQPATRQEDDEPQEAECEDSRTPHANRLTPRWAPRRDEPRLAGCLDEVTLRAMTGGGSGRDRGARTPARRIGRACASRAQQLRQLADQIVVNSGFLRRHGGFQIPELRADEPGHGIKCKQISGWPQPADHTRCHG